MSLDPTEKTSSVSLFADAKALSDSATIEALTPIASVPLASNGATNSMRPS